MGFFKDLGQSFTNIIGGLGSNIQAGANLKDATAEQIRANAAITMQQAQLQAEREKRNQQTTVIVLLIVFGVPLIGLGLFLALNNKT